MCTGMGIPHDDRVPGPCKTFFRKDGVAHPIATDIEKILDIVTAGPLAQYLALLGSFSVFGRCDMVDHGFDLGRIEYAVLAARDQVFNGRRGGNFMAKDRIEPDDVGVRRGAVHLMCVENLFSDGFTH